MDGRLAADSGRAEIDEHSDAASVAPRDDDQTVGGEIAEAARDVRPAARPVHVHPHVQLPVHHLRHPSCRQAGRQAVRKWGVDKVATLQSNSAASDSRLFDEEQTPVSVSVSV
eukprot:Selendium_serpulae@DN2479_c0_g1_i2.p2